MEYGIILSIKPMLFSGPASFVLPIARAALLYNAPAEMVLTRTPHLRPASQAKVLVSLSTAAFC